MGGLKTPDATSLIHLVARRGAAPKEPAAHPRFQALDLLATLVAVVDHQGRVLFANAVLDDDTDNMPDIALPEELSTEEIDAILEENLLKDVPFN